MSLVNEMYFAITLDRKTAGPVCPLTDCFFCPLHVSCYEQLSIFINQQMFQLPCLDTSCILFECLFMKLDISFDTSHMTPWLGFNCRPSCCIMSSYCLQLNVVWGIFYSPAHNCLSKGRNKYRGPCREIPRHDYKGCYLCP